jgi:hypothetical protein
MSVVTVYLECRYHGYAPNSSIKTQGNGVLVFRVTTGTYSAKLRPADAQVTAFRPHVTIYLFNFSLQLVFEILLSLINIFKI